MEDEMKGLRLIVMSAMVIGLTLGLAGMASAAAISCGDCHGVPPVNGDNCDNTGRGLHGIHYNYSSASYPKTVASYGKCAYCHTATTATAPTLTHNNNFVNITGGASGGRAVGLAFNATNSTCTNSCHKTSATASPWGNYTSPSVKLTCDSCHNDLGGSASLSGAHASHLGSDATVPGGTKMNAASNAGCVTCHPDNTGEGKLASGTADNGSVKAYPHASDGTNVVSNNVTLSGQINSATKDGTNTTCASACHPRSNELASPITWGGSMDCNMCHYYAATPTLAGNTTIKTGMLPGSHGLHFSGGLTCDSCHPTRTTAAHATNLPVSSTGVSFVVGLTYTGGATGNCTDFPAGCHTSTKAWGATESLNGCAGCHSYPDGNNWTGNNGHTVQYATDAAVNSHLRDAASYNKLTDTYDDVVGSNNKCGLCHGGGTHRNSSGTVNMRAATGYGKCEGEFTITVTTSGSDATCSNVKCHGGKTTPNWW
jgi:hypothetical protein